MPFVLTRQQFYDVLWRAPMLKIRSSLGLSDVMIGRTARSGDIPLPGPGYWRKVETGARLKQEPLPIPHLLSRTEFPFPGTLDETVRSLFQGEPGAIEAEEETVEVLAERLRVRMGKIAITRDLHPSIKKMEQRDQRRRWGSPVYASAAGRRVLAIATALFRAAEELGCRPYTSADNDEFKFDLTLGMTGYSLKLRIDPQTQKLSLGAAERHGDLGIVTFRDRDDLPLEGQLGEIVVTYAALAVNTRRQWFEDDRQRKLEDEERRKRETDKREREAAEAAVRRAEEERREAITAAIEDARKWSDARLLREYAAAYGRAHGDASEAIEHGNRLRSIADSIDPLARIHVPREDD